MNDMNPVEFVKKRLNAENEASWRRKQEYERVADDAAIGFFFRTEETFIHHIQEHQFPGAQILEMNGNSYLYYQLFDTYYGDGETHFSETRALYLLVDERGEFSYGREKKRSGSTGFLGRPDAQPFTLPVDAQSLSDFRDIDDTIRGKLSRHDYIELAAHMIHIQQSHSGVAVKVDGNNYEPDDVLGLTFQIKNTVIPREPRL